MKDHFLREHRMAPRTFRLCGPVDPATSRDMCVRGEELAMRLLLENEVRKESRVLIVGAGVAGTTCAATLLARGYCHVTLNDIEAAPLSLQTRVLHREVVPHGFEWPYYFHTVNKYPLIERSVMRWTGGRADDVALQFQVELNKIAGYFGAGRFWKAMPNRIIDWSYDPAFGWRVEFSFSPYRNEPCRQKYDVLVLCSGFSVENDTLEGYKGYRFWDPNDAFWGTKAHPLGNTDKVLICGAGDGGLQEFIRLVTGQSTPKPLIMAIESAIDSIARGRYQAVQALAHRHYLLSPGPDRDGKINAFSFERHQRLARYLYRKTAMQSAIGKLLLPNRPLVQLLVRGRFFTRCNTPNAMLTSLLARALVDHGNGSLPPWLFSSAVESVTPIRTIPYPQSADDWAATPVQIVVKPYGSSPPLSKEMQLLQRDGVAQVAADFVSDYRCMFVRIGPSRKKPQVVAEIKGAIRSAQGKDPPSNELRHALPQSPI